MPDRIVPHRGATGVTLTLVVLGGAFVDPWLLSCALIPLGLVLYGALSRVPSPTITVERTIDPLRPQPGETTTVTLSVTNDGDEPVSDLRVIDGVPDGVPVTAGRARTNVALRAGETTDIEYEVRARRGVHAFQTPTVVVGNPAGDAFADVAPTVDGDSRLQPSVPVRTTARGERRHAVSGSVPIDSGGDGVEFYVTREYRTGDPMNRIDWRRYAKTGALSTIEYREEGGSSAVVLVDARDVTATAVTAGAPTGRSLSLYVAGRMVDAIAERGARVGAAVIGPDDTVRWAAPTTADTTRAAGLLQTVAVDAAEDWSGPTLDLPADDAETVADWLAEQLDSTTAVLFVSAVVDDLPIDLASRLQAHGRSPLVFSPIGGVPDTIGSRARSAERDARLDRLRVLGPVVDWHPDRPLPAVLSRIEVGAT
jgi:uncharacterized repeat protein (TIGR01451 family)